MSGSFLQFRVPGIKQTAGTHGRWLTPLPTAPLHAQDPGPRLGGRSSGDDQQVGKLKRVLCENQDKAHLSDGSIPREERSPSPVAVDLAKRVTCPRSFHPSPQATGLLTETEPAVNAGEFKATRCEAARKIIVSVCCLPGLRTGGNTTR